jgi:hypothetical protein
MNESQTQRTYDEEEKRWDLVPLLEHLSEEDERLLNGCQSQVLRAGKEGSRLYFPRQSVRQRTPARTRRRSASPKLETAYQLRISPTALSYQIESASCEQMCAYEEIPEVKHRR